MQISCLDCCLELPVNVSLLSSSVLYLILWDSWSIRTRIKRVCSAVALIPQGEWLLAVTKILAAARSQLISRSTIRSL